MTDVTFRAMRGGVDLKLAKNGPSKFSEGCDHEHRQDTVCPVDGFSAVVDIQPIRHALRRRQGRSHHELRRTVSGHGLCPTHLSGKLARHRGQSFGAVVQAVPHGISRADTAFDAGRCQRIARLAHLCRVRHPSDCPGKKTPGQRRLGARTVEHGVRPGLDDDRSVLVGLSVGALSNNQGGGQDAHAARFARQHSQLYPCFRRQVARRSCPGLADPGGRRDLCDGSRLCGFLPSARLALGGGFLRDSRQVEPQSPSGLFGPDRSQYRHHLRPDNCTRWFLHPAGLPCAFATGSLQRPGNQKVTGLPHQPDALAGSNHLRALQKPLAGRVVLQMDQTASSDQAVLRHFGKCGQDTNLDRGVSLCVGGHRSEKTESQRFSLHFYRFYRSRSSRRCPCSKRFRMASTVRKTPASATN